MKFQPKQSRYKICNQEKGLDEKRAAKAGIVLLHADGKKILIMTVQATKH